jgi:two-component system, NtrC family, response regulator AtoC
MLSIDALRWRIMASLWTSLRARLVLLVVLAVFPCLALVMHDGVTQWNAAYAEAEAKAMQVATGASQQHRVLLELTRRMLVALAAEQGKHVDSVANPCILPEWSKTRPFLFYADLGFADREGKVVCSLVAASESAPPLSRPCIRHASSARELSMSPFMTGGISGRGKIDFAYPVIDDFGKVKLVAFACLDASWFDDLTWRMSLPRRATVTMIDAAGTVLSRNIEPDKWVGHSAPDVEIVKTVLRMGNGVTEATGIDGVRRIYGFVPMGDRTEAGYIYVGIPKEETVGKARNTLLRHLGWLGLAGVLGLVAVQVFAHPSVRAINTLLDTARRIARGDLTARSTLQAGQGEFGQIGAVFDTMAEALQARDTEQRAAERLVREDREILSSLIESLPSSFALINAENRLLRWNKRLQRVSGYSESEMCRKDVLDFFAVPDRDAVNQALQQAFVTGEASLDTQLVTKDAVRIPYWFTAVRATINGETCIVALGVDISERKSMEHALRKNHQTLRTILDTVPVGISLSEGRVIKWANQCWARILGFESDEQYVGKNTRILYPTDDEYHRAGRLLYHDIHAGKVTETDTLLKRMDGTILDANFRTKIVDIDDPSCETMIAVLSDVSERKRVQDALRESERRFRELVESIDLCSLIIDAQGRVVFFNDSLLRLTGWDRSEVMGRDCFTLLCPPERGKQLGTLYREAIQRGNTPLHSEIRILTRDGDKRLTKWTTTLLRDEQGTIFGSASIGEDITQQREAEEALRVSKETLEGVFHAITESILLCDVDGTVITANETAAARLGKTAEELAGTLVYDAFSPDVAATRRGYGREVMRSGKPLRFQDKREDLFLDVNLYPIVGPDGSVARVAAFGRDMSDQRLAEQALLVEKQKFESLCEHAPFGMVMIAADGTFLYVNQRFREAFGYDLRDVPNGRSWFARAFPDRSYRNEIIAAWKEDMGDATRGTSRQRVFTVRCKTGTDKIVRFIPVQVDSGEHLMAVEDITEQRKSEERLLESEERFRAVFESAADCIFIKDRTGRYTHVNPAMEKLFGLPAEKLVRMTDEPLFGAEAASCIRKVENRVMKGASVEEEPTRLVNGIPMTFSIVKVPLHDSAGRIVGLCGIARDITERKQAGARKLPGAELDSGSGAAHYRSAAMRSTLTMAQFAAATDSTILLLGESGSGKDHLARFIHDQSLRAGGPYFVVNCASVSPELADSELFGHEPGAFTGATKRKLGLLELAEGGTLLLNEIGELPVPLQAKLLTFMDTSQFTRVGGEKNITVNARILAATNRDLDHEVAQGAFRKDLFYRLNVFAITVPALRDRLDDLPVLVQQILSRLASRFQLHTVPPLGRGVMDALTSYRWPGNVRELRNVLERALILSGGGLITVRSVPLHVATDDWFLKVNFPTGRSLNDVTAEIRKLLLIEALRRTHGNRTRAALLLGISRHSVINYIKEFGLTVDAGHTS